MSDSISCFGRCFLLPVIVAIAQGHSPSTPWSKSVIMSEIWVFPVWQPYCYFWFSVTFEITVFVNENVRFVSLHLRTWQNRSQFVIYSVRFADEEKQIWRFQFLHTHPGTWVDCNHHYSPYAYTWWVQKEHTTDICHSFIKDFQNPFTDHILPKKLNKDANKSPTTPEMHCYTTDEM